MHFEELIGPRATVLHKRGLTFVAVDSSEPDLDNGTVGRGRYPWIEEQFAPPADFRVFILHHHLLPIPGTGRERNVVHDAGDTLEVLQRANVNLVLSGHKHVPYAWRLEDLFVVNAGTVSSLRLRGHTRPCYNIVEVGPGEVAVYRKYPFHGRERLIRFSPQTLEYSEARAAAARHRRGAAMTRRALVLVDGEHYPPVVRAAIAEANRDDHVVAALLLGGTEKLRSEPDYGVPLEHAGRDAAAAMVAAAAQARGRARGRPLRRAGAERARPLPADQPRARGGPLLPRRRLRVLAAAAVRRPACPRSRSSAPASGIGKTAVCGHLARLLGEHHRLVLVAMGRGGPEHPELVDGAVAPPSLDDLLERSRAGQHAASDFLEDAALARVVVGRRAPLRQRPGGRAVPLERRAGRRACPRARVPTCSCSRAPARRSRRWPPTARSWSRRPRGPPSC